MGTNRKVQEHLYRIIAIAVCDVFKIVVVEKNDQDGISIAKIEQPYVLGFIIALVLSLKCNFTPTLSDERKRLNIFSGFVLLHSNCNNETALYFRCYYSYSLEFEV